MPDLKNNSADASNHNDDLEDDHDEADDNPQPAVKDKKHSDGVADLEKVTDYAEEKEILSTGKLFTAKSDLADDTSTAMFQLQQPTKPKTKRQQ